MTKMFAPKHPAKFSQVVLEEIAQVVWEYGPVTKVIDPFAGTGRVHWLKLPFAVGVELEREWSAAESNTIVGNTLCLPFRTGEFDCMISSPCYGNRYADAHNAQDGSKRRSYTHDLRELTGDPERELHPDNAGTLHWGDDYKSFHDQAWTEVLRVLAPRALVVLNISNHIRKFTEQYVTEWHLNWFLDHGCVVEDLRRVETPRHKEGANYEARVDHENVIVMRYSGPVLIPEDIDHQETNHGANADAGTLEPRDGAELHSPLDAGEGR